MKINYKYLIQLISITISIMMIVSVLVVVAAMAATGMPTELLGAVLALLLVCVCVNTHTTAPVAADADTSSTPGPSMPPLMRNNTGEVIEGRPYMNVDKKWLKGKENTILMAQVQQMSNEGEQDLSQILSEIKEGDKDN